MKKFDSGVLQLLTSMSGGDAVGEPLAESDFEDQIEDAARLGHRKLQSAVVAVGAAAVLALIVSLLAIGLVLGSALPLVAKNALITVALGVSFGALFLATTIPVLFDRRASRIFRAAGVACYLEGSSPYTGRRVVLGRTALYFVDGGSISRLPWSSVQAVGVDVRISGAVVVLAVGSKFVGFAVVGRLGGPLALLWSHEGWAGVGRLKRAILKDFADHEVPVAEVDWSNVAA